MGVVGLLPLLKSIHKQSELKKYAGKTLGVDAYGWLHRGAIACASELAQGKPTRKYVQFAMHRVNMLRHFGVTPYIVFDGDFLPSKAGTEASRARSREEHAKKGMAYLQAGKSTLAFQEFQKAIDVTPEMARHLIEELKELSIAYVVAPYEADAQLVYLERKGLIDGIVSEDSDMLVFGCKRLITKLDKYGSCIEINRRDFCACREVSLTGWTDSDFRRMAILSGCDYLDGLKGMGLKTAYRHLRKHKTPEKVVQRLRLEGRSTISEDYLPSFYQAELTFLHQRVFCPEKKELVLLTDDPTGKAKDMPFIGGYVEPEMARAIAKGDVNPITKQPIRIAGQSPKRPRTSSIPAEPVAAAVRSAAAASKPINSYFRRDTRIPMGEMDRNCFAVDRQRVADITHNGLVPRVFPLPRPYIDESRAPRRSSLPASQTARPSAPQLRRRMEGISTTLANLGHSTDPHRRHTTGSGLVRHENVSNSSSSAQRPSKKARLCNTGTETADDALDGAERSKFFPSASKKSSTEPEVTTLAPPTLRRDDLLFSDDSIEEALLSLPTPDGWDIPSVPRKNQSFEVFDDEAERRKSTALESCPESPVQNVGDNVEEEEGSENGMLPPHRPGPDRPTSTPPRLSSARISLESFFYQSETGSPNASGNINTPASSASTASTAPSSRPAMLFTPSLGVSTPATPFTAASMMTPLQRLGSRALKRGGAATPSGVLGSENAMRGKRSSLDALPVNPAFVPLPRVDLDEVAALNTCGSEDQIPFIEDESPETDAEFVDGLLLPPRASVPIDLSRFLHR
ncbi:related to EXO1 - exonuclease which interacts with Msh2p [Cephalotrichum gorgonifer]|uniref:Related to EXO1 - exonuclease which interacts with Msh2p n=1 Tax=Cephalotrichum gorgonifer TaxID=2041049 RepID=A0AAE8N4K6_9PEZI|nr:related to EXO1 - exonuclease which interacts with Msh2p [Cephalotrichum gorgonifer]